jgi:hypothetical protein
MVKVTQQRPAVFVGSSSEGKDVAKAIQVLLDSSCQVEIWDQGVFELTKSALESLVSALDRFDFAILVLTADDLTISRKKRNRSVRDNVIFELGLFIGGLGQNRTFMISDRSNPPKLPSDLLGITTGSFTPHTTGNYRAALGAVCTEIEDIIKKLGFRNQEKLRELDNTALEQCSEVNVAKKSSGSKITPKKTSKYEVEENSKTVSKEEIITANVPASHRSNGYKLPPISAIVYAGEESGQLMTAEQGFEEWFQQSNSNLLVLMGEMGSGKTTSLQKISEDWRNKSDFIDFNQFITSNEGNEITSSGRKPVIIIDNFDAVNSLVGLQVTPPNLRIIGNLASSHRVILSTRRTPKSQENELLKQLKDLIRLSKLGFQNPFIIQLIPWKLEHLKTFGDQNNDPSLVSLSKFLSGMPEEDTVHLRRPLLITMLLNLKLGDRRSTAIQNEALVVGKIYKQYCDTTLSVDYDLKRSQISGTLKLQILSDLAFDIFSGTAFNEKGQAALSVSLDRVSERVVESVLKDPALRSLPNNYDWTKDFLNSNPLFEEIRVSSLSDFAEKQYGFIHQSFYEYFVGLTIIRSIVRLHSLGLKLESLSSATVDSLALVFVKQLGGSELRTAIKELLTRPRLTFADRLILLYLLEDDLEFEIVIEKLPSDYFDLLEKEIAKESYDSFFLRKMMLYQLVIKGRYTAENYVSEIKRYEDEKNLLAEEKLHSTEVSVTNQLLQRLESPALKRAKYITIYRLGQLGSELAIHHLMKIANDDALLSKIAQEAIEKINSRVINQ